MKLFLSRIFMSAFLPVVATSSMRVMVLMSALWALLLTGCAHRVTADSNTQSAALLFPAASGAQQAHRDIVTGRLQLMEAGTRGVYAPNVPIGDLRFSKLPRHRLPSGCTVPNASAWMRYAEAYNRVVVEHIKKHWAL